MNRLVRALVGVVVAKAAVAAGWYLYQKSTEQENDWKTEGEPEVKPEVKEEVKSVEPVAVTTDPVVDKAPQVEKTVKPAVKKSTARVKKEVAKVEEAPKAKRVRKPAVKKVAPAPAVETKVPAKKATRTRAKKAE